MSLPYLENGVHSIKGGVFVYHLQEDGSFKNYFTKATSENQNGCSARSIANNVDWNDCSWAW
jgi:hypothetical protein